MSSNPLRLSLGIQSLYYLATGLLPMVSMSTFEALTGPKTDDWLVRMVALLAIVIGVTLGVAVWRRSYKPDTMVLAIGSALAFGAIDVIYASTGRISKIYLADAVVEIAFILILLGVMLRQAQHDTIAARHDMEV